MCQCHSKYRGMACPASPRKQTNKNPKLLILCLYNFKFLSTLALKSNNKNIYQQLEIKVFGKTSIQNKYFKKKLYIYF